MKILQSIRYPLRKTTEVIIEKSDGQRDRIEFYLRGGICFPIPVAPGQSAGFAVLLGLNVVTRKIYVLEQSPWVCVDPMPLRERFSGGLETLSSCMNTVWARWYSRTWDHIQSESLADQYAKQLRVSPMIAARPQFFPVRFDTIQEANGILLAASASERLAVEPGSPCHRAMTWIQSTPGSSCMDSPETVALVSALAGIEQRPWGRQDMPYSSGVGEV
jgi:hypothetical protein